jgi:hypothetical protein
LIASAVILQNTADMMQALRAMEKDGIKVDVDDISFLSPYFSPATSSALATTS